MLVAIAGMLIRTFSSSCALGIINRNVLEKKSSHKSSCSWNKIPAEFLFSFSFVKIQ